MTIRPRPLLVACAALALAAPVAATRPCHHRPHAAPTEAAGVTVHRGVAGEGGLRFAEGGAPWFGDEGGGAPIGYWESNDGREDDAAIFAGRYGCARPIWNAKSDRYMPACN